MRHIVNLGMAAIIVILLAVSCSPVIAPSVADPAASANGSIVIGLKSLFSKPLEPVKSVKVNADKMLNAASGPDKAIALMTSYTVRIIDSMDQEIASQTFTSSMIFQVMSVPAGIYTVTADIYNSVMSTTVPIVSGTITGVEVTEGGYTSVNIVCLPTSTTALSDGEWSAGTPFVPVQWDTTNWTSSGTEEWYTFVPTNDALRMTINSDCFVHYGIYEFDGSNITDGTIATGTHSITMGVVSGQTYYFVLTNFSGANGTISIMCESIDPIPVTGVTFDLGSIDLDFGEVTNLGYTISPANATITDVTWSSSDSAIVYLYSDGQVQGRGEGTAAITVTTVDGSFTDTIDITVAAPIFESWTTTALDGGTSSGSAVQLPSLDTWYTSSVTYGSSTWYYVTVNTSNTYDFYWDDDFSGSGTYTSDLMVRFYHLDGTTVYNDRDSGFFSPCTITPVEGTILIEVDGYYSGGTYAIGVHQQ